MIFSTSVGCNTTSAWCLWPSSAISPESSSLLSFPLGQCWENSKYLFTLFHRCSGVTPVSPSSTVRWNSASLLNPVGRPCHFHKKVFGYMIFEVSLLFRLSPWVVWIPQSKNNWPAWQKQKEGKWKKINWWWNDNILRRHGGGEKISKGL